MTVRELLVKIGIDSDTDELDEIEDKLGGIATAAKGLATILAGTAAAYTATGVAASNAATNFVEYSEEVVRNAQSLGMATDKYQQFRFAFKNLNASVDDMMDAFSTVTDRAQDALSGGSKEYRRQFERLGISMDELRGKEPGEIFTTYMANAQKVVSRTDSVTSAVRLFGDDLGRRIMPALTSSTESFKQLMDRAREAGVVMGEDVLEAGRQVRMEFRTLRGEMNAVWRLIGYAILPLFGHFIDRLSDFFQWLQRSGTAVKAARSAMQIWSEDIEKLIMLLEDMGQLFNFEGVAKNLDQVFVYVKLITLVISSGLVVAMGYLTYTLMPILLTQLGAVVGISTALGWVQLVAALTAATVALAGLVLLAEDLWVWFSGGASVVGLFVDKWREGSGVIEAWLEAFDAMKPTLMTLWKGVKQFSMVVGVLVYEILEHALYVVLDIVQAFLHLVAVIVEALFNAINMVFDFAMKAMVAIWFAFKGEWNRAGSILWRAIKEGFSALWDLIKDLIFGIVDLAKNMLGGLIAEVWSAIADLLSYLPWFSDEMAEQMKASLDFQLGLSKSPFTDKMQKVADDYQAQLEAQTSMFAGEALGATAQGPAPTNSMVPESMMRGNENQADQRDQSTQINQEVKVEGMYNSTDEAVREASEKGAKQALDENKGGPV